MKKVNAWRLGDGPRAKSSAAGLMQKLLAFEFTSDTALFELFDKECPRLMQVTGIDIQDEVKCGLVTLHMQDDALRHHIVMYASGLDTIFKDRKEVQDIARAREAKGGVAPVQ